MPVALTGPSDSHLLDLRAVPCSAPRRCCLGLGLASPLLRGPTARLAFAAAAPISGRSHPRPSGSDNPGCPPPRLCALLAPALTHPAALRHSHARGSPRLSASAQAHTRPQARSQPQASSSCAARGTQRPYPQPRRRHSHPPPLHCDQRSPAVNSLERRGVFTLMHSPIL